MSRSILRTSAVVALLVAAGLPVAAPSDAASPRAFHDAGCKPQAPIEVVFEERAADGPLVDLAFSVRPLRDLVDVTWELLLPDDASLLAGARRGRGASAAAQVTEGSVRLALPADGRPRRARLVVRASMPVVEEDGTTSYEPIGVSRTLSWGEPSPVGRIVLTPDAETGRMERVVALPTVHRPGP